MRCAVKNHHSGCPGDLRRENEQIISSMEPIWDRGCPFAGLNSDHLHSQPRRSLLLETNRRVQATSAEKQEPARPSS
jgi:hypothetical protein